MIEYKRLSSYDTISSQRELWDCVQQCMDTQRVCWETVSYCLDNGDKYAALSRVRMLIDAASSCQTTIEDSRIGSPLFLESCDYCARLLDHCARELASLSRDSKIHNCITVCQ